MTALEAMSEAKRQKLTVDDALFLIAIAQRVSAKVVDLIPLYPELQPASVRQRVLRLRKAGFLEHVPGAKWDWPSYRLTSKAKAWKEGV